MPDPTPTTNTAHLTAGTEFKIGSTTIPGCFSTPEFIFDPEMVDTSTFDDGEYASQIPGLQKPNTLDFEFRNYGTNYTAAKATVRTPGTTYTVTFPSGTTVTITGQHVLGPSAAGVNNPENFKIKITATDIDTEVASNSSSSSGSGSTGG